MMNSDFAQVVGLVTLIVVDPNNLWAEVMVDHADV